MMERITDKELSELKEKYLKNKTFPTLPQHIYVHEIQKILMYLIAEKNYIDDET